MLAVALHLYLPDISGDSRRKALDPRLFLQSRNPFASVQTYARGSAALQKAVARTTIQTSLDGEEHK